LKGFYSFFGGKINKNRSYFRGKFEKINIFGGNFEKDFTFLAGKF
jgi:hypothetical protein